ncbi:type II secretion system F family protein [Megasphaera lornae]|uniref:Bacterial type II secretion system domain protein F n=1 Tax=Megasphaera lornae TaxID=1000568 RepID=D3LW88_9FIRM|nr:type II secretion system F family protein [Megasphaera genomosp. type_1]EFD93555.1 bacterial type II secretion system domain protein F [Megasphaera genomosp. type_1 str. 28L]KXB90315.1 bacterial type II secretion system protein F domain protein [Veillonellaceae bacterium DNF00751]MUP50201.1 type II secretion system F family protein [Veillonellaceae bacterium M1-70]
MRAFIVKFMTPKGEEKNCILQAENRGALKTLAEQQGWRILQIREKKSIWKKLHTRTLSGTQLIFWFQQMAVLLSSGIPLVQAWTLLCRDWRKAGEKQCLQRGVFRLEQGISVTEVLEESELFPVMVIPMVRAGEQSGQLAEIFQLLGTYYTYVEKQKQGVLQALLYPAFLCCCALGAAIFAIFFLLPVFENLFSQMNAPVPPLTRGLLQVSHSIRAYGPEILIGLGVLTVAVYGYSQQSQRRQALTMRLWRIPGVRKLLLMFSWQRCCQLLAIQIRSGIPLLTALSEAASAVPISGFRRHIHWLCLRLEGGESFSAALAKSQVHLPYVSAMLAIGEESGQYDRAMQAVADYYRWQLTVAVARFRRFLGPAALLMVGGIIGLLVCCLVLPVLDMITTMSL